MTESTNLFTDQAEPLSTDDRIEPAVAAGVGHEPGAGGTSPGQSGAVRSRPGGRDADDSEGKARTGRLPAMLLPELQRLAQSLGITGTGRMRKGQIIAAIEERQQRGPASADGYGASSQPVVSSGSAGGSVAAANPASAAGPGSPAGSMSAAGSIAAANSGALSGQSRGNQSEVNGNSVQRSVPAGAGANRPFEQDAMESEGSGQLSMVSEYTAGSSEPDGGARLATGTAVTGTESATTGNIAAVGTAVGQTGDGDATAGQAAVRGRGRGRASQAGAQAIGAEAGGSAEIGQGGDAREGAHAGVATDISAAAAISPAEGGRVADLPPGEAAHGADTGQDGESGAPRRGNGQGDAGSRRENQRGRSRNGNGRRDDQGRAAADGGEQARDAGRGDQQGGRGDQQRDAGGQQGRGDQQGYRDQGGRDQGGRDQGGRDQGGRDQGGRDDDRDGQSRRSRDRAFQSI